jgi:hypothetical protein
LIWDYIGNREERSDGSRHPLQALREFPNNQHVCSVAGCSPEVKNAGNPMGKRSIAGKICDGEAFSVSVRCMSMAGVRFGFSGIVTNEVFLCRSRWEYMARTLRAQMLNTQGRQVWRIFVRV